MSDTQTEEEVPVTPEPEPEPEPTRFYVHADGTYIGGFYKAEPPEGAIEVPFAPDHAARVWNFNTGDYDALPIEPAPPQ